MTVILNESGIDIGMTFEAYAAQAAEHGVNPTDLSGNPDNFVFVSKAYAESDKFWDVDESWPDDLPLWEYRPA